MKKYMNEKYNWKTTLGNVVSNFRTTALVHLESKEISKLLVIIK